MEKPKKKVDCLLILLIFNSGMIMSHVTYVLCFTSRLKGHDDTVGVLVADFLNLAKFLRLKKDESEVEIRVSC